ncbi:MAG TPA: hypothetical protein VFW45_00615 [Candidatus Polarisedimenticolia bacterium]|nr:hypothetical protein [Candidatus Polarisedimenticolia bacterium]
MASPAMSRKDLELLVLRALGGERVPLLLGGKRFTLTVDPLFKVCDETDGFLFLCLGLSGLKTRLDRLAEPRPAGPENLHSKLGGAQGSH